MPYSTGFDSISLSHKNAPFSLQVHIACSVCHIKRVNNFTKPNSDAHILKFSYESHPATCSPPPLLVTTGPGESQKCAWNYKGGLARAWSVWGAKYVTRSLLVWRLSCPSCKGFTNSGTRTLCSLSLHTHTSALCRYWINTRVVCSHCIAVFG